MTLLAQYHDAETNRDERVANGICKYDCECIKCLELALLISRFDEECVDFEADYSDSVSQITDADIAVD